jgi:signal transduction histidine kinase
MTERAARGAALDREDVELLREELARLGGMNARLRELAFHGSGKSPCSAQRLLELAVRAAGVGAPGAGLTLEVNAAQAQELMCDEPRLALALAELLRNACDARQAAAGVRFVTGEASGYCVWDDGPGFTLDFQQALTWGTTTKRGAAGLGLTLAFRAARAHGFDLTYHRKPGRTEVWLLIPAGELRAAVAKVDA